MVLNIGFTSKIKKGVEDGLGDEMFGEIDEKRYVGAGGGIVCFGELGKSFWVI